MRSSIELSTGAEVLEYGGVLEDGEEGEAAFDFKEGKNGSSGCFFSNHRSCKTYIEGD